MARTNAELAPGIETILLAPAPRFAHVSSTLVRQIATAGGDASRFVRPAVAEALQKLPKDLRRMSQRKKISTPHAPAAIGPYSQAIVAGGFVHCSGQIALDPEDGQDRRRAT